MNLLLTAGREDELLCPNRCCEQEKQKHANRDRGVDPVEWQDVIGIARGRPS
jgi:hypothetical protein